MANKLTGWRLSCHVTLGGSIDYIIAAAKYSGRINFRIYISLATRSTSTTSKILAFSSTLIATVSEIKL